jgi:hypothetical protein
MQHLAFFNIEKHAPIFRPITYILQVILQPLCVLIVCSYTDQLCVVRNFEYLTNHNVIYLFS